ncbi:MAG: DNA-binding response regulator [Spirochaetae bacterium HGW-Spirochaetae-1]|nr:MAG: DNA-binding response regulator [Spirochaetae bacterium HGW-Spirochaetae-1]
MAKIVLVEDHPIFRKGLAQLINNEKDMTVCGESEDSVEALRIVKELEPDLVIVDITLKDRNGIELIKDIKIRFPEMKIIVISMHDEKIYAERALRAGAKGYIMKQEAPETILKAIHHVLNNNVYVSNDIATRIFNLFFDGRAKEDNNPVNQLTDRELEIFQLIGQGFGTRQIASKLHISVKTVENHRAHIKEKLNLKSAIELVQQATLWLQRNQTT